MLTTQRARLLPCLVILLTVTHSQTGPEWTQKPLTPDTAQAFLEATLHGEKNVTIAGVIANTDFKCEPGNVMQQQFERDRGWQSE